MHRLENFTHCLILTYTDFKLFFFLFKVGGKVIKLEGGDPGHTIVSKSEELGAKLIVVGSRGLGTIRRKILGSVSEFILHHATIPVFVCRQ